MNTNDLKIKGVEFKAAQKIANSLGYRGLEP
jgi:hypothetical protein